MYTTIIDTSAYRPMRCSKDKWELGTMNDHIRALNGWTSQEADLREVKWRLQMFCNAGPFGEEYCSPEYQSWRNLEKNTLRFFDKLCGVERTSYICPPGFTQGYVNIPALLNELEEVGHIDLPFSKVYDIRQYVRNINGCKLIVVRS